MIIEPGSHLRNQPYAGVPQGLVWPKKTQTAINAYEKAWGEYDDAVLKLDEAEGLLESALAEDTRALIAAVKIEAEDPGPVNESAARRALAYASERVRQKHSAVGIAQEAMYKQVQAEPGDVIAQAARIEREHLAALFRAHEEAGALVDRANATFTAFGDAVNGLEELGVHTVPGVNWGAPLSAPGFTLPGIDAWQYNHANQWLDAIDKSLEPEPEPDED
jgi:hypothetical protein